MRGTSTVTQEGACPAGAFRLELAGGAFRGTPVGTGAYRVTIRLGVASGFPKGEGGVCAPIRGRITLGTGTPDRLVLGLEGDSCQDGAGDPGAAAFTSLTRFTVRYGTGAYAGARGGGLLSSAEDAADRERLTLVGRLSRCSRLRHGGRALGPPPGRAPGRARSTGAARAPRPTRPAAPAAPRRARPR